MRVGDRIALCCIAPHCKGIGSFSICTRNDIGCHFFHRIGDICAVFLRIQIAKDSSPLVVRRNRHGLSCVNTVCQQSDGDIFRSDGIVIAGIGPYFRHVHLGLTRGVMVCHVKAVDLGRVVRNDIFRYGVGDLIALCEFRQVCKAPLPAICFGHGNGIYFLAVCFQADGDALRTLAIPVISIIPRLASLDLDGRRRMTVGNRVALSHIPLDGTGIAARTVHAGDDIRSLLFDGVGNILA